MDDPLDGWSEVPKDSRSEADWVKFHQDLEDRIEAKTTAISNLMAERHFDFLAVGFCDAHDVGHQSWHWHDETAPNHPAELVAKYGNPVLQIYQKLDSAVGRLIEAANPDHVFVVSGLGMGAQTSCSSWNTKILNHLCGAEMNSGHLESEDRAKLPYFELIHNMNSAAIRINLQGRESEGVIAPEDYDSTCDFLCEKFMEITDSETGQPVVTEVIRCRDEYPGPNVDRLPDLLAIWQREKRVNSIHVPGLGDLPWKPRLPYESRSGDHTPNAGLISNSKFQFKGPLTTQMIAPMITSVLGCSIPGLEESPPKLMNSKPLNSLFEQPALVAGGSKS